MKLSRDEYLAMYRRMVTVRQFETVAGDLFSQARGAGFYPPVHWPGGLQCGNLLGAQAG
jgi:TPP-dependent pyruvate/acetoin dehydrogenase alpha subunit